MDRNRTARVAPLVAVLLLGGGCFNDAFRGHEVNGADAAMRFELLIEPDRTLVEGTHFLVDRATGDVWRLDVAGRSAGTWVRLADGPSDVAEIDFGLDLDDDDEERED